jgi:hypothetical protein
MILVLHTITKHYHWHFRRMTLFKYIYSAAICPRIVQSSIGWRRGAVSSSVHSRLFSLGFILFGFLVLSLLFVVLLSAIDENIHSLFTRFDFPKLVQPTRPTSFEVVKGKQSTQVAKDISQMLIILAD